MIDIQVRNREEILRSVAKQGKSLADFSEVIGISKPYLSQILNGKRNPSAKIAHKIADELGEPVEKLFLIRAIVKLK